MRPVFLQSGCGGVGFLQHLEAAMTISEDHKYGTIFTYR
jgi:hypothetical protein